MGLLECRNRCATVLMMVLTSPGITSSTRSGSLLLLSSWLLAGSALRCSSWASNAGENDQYWWAPTAS